MSLIDDALRRTAAETARKEAARQGEPVDWTPPPPLPDQRRQGGAIWLAAGGVVVAVLLTIFFWPRRAPERAALPAPARMVLPTPSPIPAREAFHAASPAFPADTEELAPIASAPQPEEAPITASASPPPATPFPATEPETRIAAAVPAPEQEEVPTPESSIVEEIPPAENEEGFFDEEPIGPSPDLDFLLEDEASASPEIVRRPAPSRTIIPKPASRAPAPPQRGAGGTRASSPAGGGPASASGKLELGGIVFSEGNPVALINGRVVSAGSYVDGYEVVRVEATSVELRAEDGKKVVLKLK